MKNLTKTLVLTAAFSSSLLMATEVDNTAVTTFSAGTPAKAGEVNSNFTALIQAINDNFQRINDNANEIAALQSAASKPLLDRISGKSFKVFVIGDNLEQEKFHSGQLEGSTSAYFDLEQRESVLTLSAGGSAAETEGVSKSMFELDSPEVESYSATGTWQLSGQVLTLNFDDEKGTIEFYVSPDGSIFTSSYVIQEQSEETSEFGDYTQVEFDVHYWIAIRVD